MIESRRMRWTGHVTRIGEIRMLTKFWSEGLKRRDHYEDLLEWILGKQGRKVWTGCIWLRTGTSGGLLQQR